MSKKKQQSKQASGIKWPSTNTVKLRELEKRAKGAIQKNNEKAKDIKKLIRLDAMSRLPMPSHTKLAEEIAAAHAAPKLIAGSDEAKADKKNYEETNAAWDQVNQIRVNIATMLAIPRMIAPFATAELLENIPKLEKSDFVRICKLLSADTVEYVRIMNDIHARHKDKTGNAVGFQEQELSRYVFGEYVEISQLWMDTTLPVIEHMVALLQSGLSALAVENEALATQLSQGIGNAVDGLAAVLAGSVTQDQPKE